ncbi:hypothetical protein HK096_003828 [Nowakowskiella sp. JEL0078]|nr:hypothetical protein HK096_003828 [Nowakowskiella sp. JEL0078]
MAVAIQSADLILALNLIIVFVFNKTNTRKLEKWYYIISIIFSGGISAVPFVFGRLGRGRYECWFALKPEEELINQFLWEWTSFYIWAGISIGFCSISTLLFWWSLSAQAKIIEEQTIAQDNINRLNNRGSHSNNESTRVNNTINLTKSSNITINLSKMVRRAVTRISLYCLVPLFSQVCKNSVSAIEFMTSRPAPWQLVLAAIVTSGLQGFFNAVIFLIDPAISRAREEDRIRFVKNHLMRYDGVVVDPEMLENEDGVDFKSEPFKPISTWNHLMRWYAYLFLVGNRDFERFRQVDPADCERFNGFAAVKSAALTAPGALIAVLPAAVSISNIVGDSSTEVASSNATAGDSTPSTLGRLSLWSSSILSWTDSSPTPWHNTNKFTAASSDYSSRSDKATSPLAGVPTPATQKSLNRIVRENQMLVSSPVDEYVSLGRESMKTQSTPQRNFSWGRLTHNVLLDRLPPIKDDGKTLDPKGKKSTSSLDELNLTSNPLTQRTFGGDFDDRNKLRLSTDSGQIRPTWSGDEQKSPAKSILVRPSLASMKSSKHKLEFEILPTEEIEDEKTTIVSRSSTINRKVHSAGPSGRNSPALTINTELTSLEMRERFHPIRSGSRTSTTSAILDLPRWDPKRKNRTVSGPKALWGRTESRSSRPGSPISYITRSGTPSSMRSELRDDSSIIVDLGDDDLNIENGNLGSSIPNQSGSRVECVPHPCVQSSPSPVGTLEMGFFSTLQTFGFVVYRFWTNF